MDAERTGKLIAAALRKCGMEQHQLAKRLGVSRQSVFRWVNGDVMPGAATLQRIADQLETTVGRLLGKRNGSPRAKRRRRK